MKLVSFNNKEWPVLIRSRKDVEGQSQTIKAFCFLSERMIGILLKEK